MGVTLSVLRWLTVPFLPAAHQHRPLPTPMPPPSPPPTYADTSDANSRPPDYQSRAPYPDGMSFPIPMSPHEVDYRAFLRLLGDVELGDNSLGTRAWTSFLLACDLINEGARVDPPPILYQSFRSTPLGAFLNAASLPGTRFHDPPPGLRRLRTFLEVCLRCGDPLCVENSTIRNQCEYEHQQFPNLLRRSLGGLTVPPRPQHLGLVPDHKWQRMLELAHPGAFIPDSASAYELLKHRANMGLCVVCGLLHSHETTTSCLLLQAKVHYKMREDWMSEEGQVVHQRHQSEFYRPPSPSSLPPSCVLAGPFGEATPPLRLPDRRYAQGHPSRLYTRLMPLPITPFPLSNGLAPYDILYPSVPQVQSTTAPHAPSPLPPPSLNSNSLAPPTEHPSLAVANDYDHAELPPLAEGTGPPTPDLEFLPQTTATSVPPLSLSDIQPLLLSQNMDGTIYYDNVVPREVTNRADSASESDGEREAYNTASFIFGREAVDAVRSIPEPTIGDVLRVVHDLQMEQFRGWDAQGRRIEPGLRSPVSGDLRSEAADNEDPRNVPGFHFMDDEEIDARNDALEMDWYERDESEV